MPSAGQAIRTLRAGFAAPPPDGRVMMRWWWFGPFVEEAELARELEAMAAAGIGGVEVAAVYPLSTSEAEREAGGFLSERHLSRLRFAAETADRLGLRFDVTLGSGWSYGGPHITDETAARRLRWDAREVPPRALRIAPQPWPGDELVAAYVGDGSEQEPPTRWEPLAVDDGAVEVPAGSGPRVVLLAISSPTGQNVKRAAAGAEGPVLDHCSRAATEAHLRAVADPILAAVGSELVTAVFCDSLEVYAADWTPALPAEFRARRGYDLLPELPLLHTRGEGSQRLRADVAATLGELYEENFVAVAAEWAAAHDVLFRIQSYGQPPGTLSAYRHADLPEGEGWGWRSVTQTKWATSAAHLYDRRVVSSETWTWVHSPSFAATPLDLAGEAHEHLLLGVNQLIGHGWPYSPHERPGWIFYASGALNDANPWWPAMPELSRYLHRLCWLMQQGEPVVDVALYAPSRDAAASFTPGTRGYLDLWHATRDHIGEELPAALRDAGYDYDLIDDTALQEADRSRYRVIVLPDVADLPEATARLLEKQDVAVVTVGGRVHRDGWTAVEDVAGLLPALGALVPPDAPTAPDACRAPQGGRHRRLPRREHRPGAALVHAAPARCCGRVRAVGRPHRARPPGRRTRWRGAAGAAAVRSRRRRRGAGRRPGRAGRTGRRAGRDGRAGRPVDRRVRRRPGRAGGRGAPAPLGGRPRPGRPLRRSHLRDHRRRGGRALRRSRPARPRTRAPPCTGRRRRARAARGVVPGRGHRAGG
ncbi:hypothetical protein BJF90_12095 [Pseudonocardia sp. CNS-004]|nr:hypothetical protein BJF90_12095 [Pseudonocardia sp. CNS-004]